MHRITLHPWSGVRVLFYRSAGRRVAPSAGVPPARPRGPRRETRCNGSIINENVEAGADACKSACRHLHNCCEDTDAPTDRPTESGTYPGTDEPTVVPSAGTRQDCVDDENWRCYNYAGDPEAVPPLPACDVEDGCEYFHEYPRGAASPLPRGSRPRDRARPAQVCVSGVRGFPVRLPFWAPGQRCVRSCVL